MSNPSENSKKNLSKFFLDVKKEDLKISVKEIDNDLNAILEKLDKKKKETIEKIKK